MTPGSIWCGPPADDEPRANRDIYGVNFVEAPPDEGQALTRRLVKGLGAAIAIATRKVMAKFEAQPQAVQTTTEALQDATELATNAVTGKLEAASLEGELKRAQIAELYANARRANAEAGKVEADTAWADLERCIELAQRLGAPVGLSKLPDGRLCVSLGEGASAQLPAVEIPRHLSTGAGQIHGEASVTLAGSVSVEVTGTAPSSTPEDEEAVPDTPSRAKKSGPAREDPAV